MKQREILLHVVCCNAGGQRPHGHQGLQEEENEEQANRPEMQGQQRRLFLQMPWECAPQIEQLRLAVCICARIQ